MAVIHAPKVEGGEFTDDRKQIVRVPTGLYGGMFAWYSLPKAYPKFQSQEMEMKFFVGFTITHDRANQQLPHFSEAVTSIRPKLFFDPKNGMKSAYVALLYALSGGKTPLEQIVDMGDIDLDTFIGRPAILFVEANQKPDKNGLMGHRLKSIEPADAGLIAAIKPLYQQRKTENGGGEHQLLRLSYPRAALEEEAMAAGNDGTSYGGDLDDEIPF